jgi:DNA-binding CsgD family transcriptional regulator
MEPEFARKSRGIDTLTQVAKMTTALVPRGLDGEGQLSDDFEIGQLSAIRSQVASEVGAAMAHELNGPMTALLLYVGDIHQNCDGLRDRSGDNESLKLVVENALHEAERICTLIHRMGDYFEAPIGEDATIHVGRDAIAWWSRTGNPAAKLRADARIRAADAAGRAAARPLTPRESEVLRLVSEGLSNKQGALLMNISYRTFECHRAEVMRKLGAKNTAQLVRMALEMTGSSTSPDGSGA